MGCCKDCTGCNDCQPCAPANPCTELELGCTQQIDAECVFVDDTTIIEVLEIEINSNLEVVINELITYINTQINEYEYVPTGLGGDCIAGGAPFDFDTWLQNLEAYVCTLEQVLTFDNALERTVNNVQWGGSLVKDTTVGGGNLYFTTFDNVTTFNALADDAISLSAGGAGNNYLSIINTPSPSATLYSLGNVTIEASSSILTGIGGQVILQSDLTDIQLNSATDIIVNPANTSEFQINSDTIKGASAVNGYVWTLTDNTTGAGEWQVNTATAIITERNAITQPVAGTIEWGGTLIQDTQVDGGSTWDVTFLAPDVFTVSLATEIALGNVSGTAGINIEEAGGGLLTVIAQGSPGTAGQVLTSDGTNADWQDADHNTLDEAYDQGGAGVGRTITADTGAVVVDGADGFFVKGTYGAGATIDSEVTGSGMRMFFNPRKGAFRAGEAFLTGWDDANVGDFSIAMGYQNTASGLYSVAFQRTGVASGTYSTVFGFNSDATGEGSFVTGTLNTGSGAYSTSFGSSNLSEGNNSLTVGTSLFAKSYAEASFGLFGTDYTANSPSAHDTGDRVFNLGIGTGGGARADALTVLKSGDIGAGINNFEGATTGELLQLDRAGGLAIKIVDGNEAVGRVLTSDANGRGTWADPTDNHITGITFNVFPSATSNAEITVTSTGGGAYSGTFELYQLYNENPSTPVVNNINPLALNSIAIGQDNVISGSGADRNIFIGYDNTNAIASDDNYIFGRGNSVTNSGYAFGRNNSASGFGATAVGWNNNVQSAYGVAVGYNNLLTQDWNVACGHGTTNNGRYGFTANHGTVVESFAESAFGRTPTSYVANNVLDWHTGDRLFIIAREPGALGVTDQFTVLKDGRIGINYDNFEAVAQASNEVFHVHGNGNAGAVRVTDGTEGDGKVLTSDVNGVGTWQGTVILTASRTLTTAEIGALHTTPIELIASPGADKYLDIISVSSRADFNTTAWTTGFQDIELDIAGGIIGVSGTSGFDHTNSTQVARIPIIQGNAFVEVNAGLNISASSAITGGDSEITVHIAYRVVDMS